MRGARRQRGYRLSVVHEFEDHVRQLTEDSCKRFFPYAAKSGYEMIGPQRRETRAGSEMFRSSSLGT